jgi:hypothetical protein
VGPATGGSVRDPLRTHPDETNDAVLSPDVRAPAVSGDDGTAAVFDWPVGRLVKRFDSVGSKVFELGFRDGGLHTWDRETGQSRPLTDPALPAADSMYAEFESDAPKALLGYFDGRVRRAAFTFDLAGPKVRVEEVQPPVAPFTGSREVTTLAALPGQRELVWAIRGSPLS